MIGIVNYGVGNLQSVLNALDFVGAPARIVASPSELDGCDKAILPGVGAFRRAMDMLEEAGFRAPLDEHALGKRRPLLGICVGMQLLADRGTEFETRAGLGYIKGTVAQIPIDRNGNQKHLRLPHIGWNDVRVTRENALVAELPPERSAYFVHSFHFEVEDQTDRIADTDYGGSVTAAVARDNVFGVQFHPEKSQDLGLRILRNFAAL